MSDALQRVKDLTAKRDKARTALTVLQTQREAAVATKAQAEAELLSEFSTTPDKAPELLGELSAKRDGMLEAAEADLNKVNL